MDRWLDIGHVAETLPDLDSALADPRLRPLGLVGGLGLIVAGALLQVSPAGGFWSSVVSGVFVFAGIPLFCVGLAAPEPETEDALFHVGVDLSTTQRRIVALGSLLVLASPVIVAVLGPSLQFATGLWLAAATVALFGAVLILTGFLAWTSKTLAEQPVS